tara:strand:+ start:225 stop:362 length:138 start_codon:yes stop_codon:yes gene_type:complete
MLNNGFIAVNQQDDELESSWSQDQIQSGLVHNENLCHSKGGLKDK